MVRIWTWTTVVTLLVLGQYPISGYRVNNEPLSRQGCIWSTNKWGSHNNSTTSNGAYVSTEMALNCNVRTLNTEFWNYTFSPEQRERTTALELRCNDKLYFESNLKLNSSFSRLIHLKSVSFDSCKIRKIPRGIWNRFHALKTLTIHTHNSDWSPSIGMELESNCFQGLTQLNSLDLSSSNVWNLPDQLLCPNLINLVKFNLSTNRLIDLPDEFVTPNDPESESACRLRIQNLDLSWNSIRRVGRNAFSRLGDLTQLRFQQNLIEELEDTAFNGLPRLRFLNLSGNRLVALPPTIFKSNPMLRELYLRNNSITALSPAVFSSLSQLVMLDLSLNALSSLWIKETVFHGLGQLIALKLSFNQLVYIDQIIFKPLLNLQALHLDNNRIETIHPEALSSLTNLHLLDLSRNRLTSVDSRLLASGFLLKRLYLDHNKINTVGETALDNCTNLQDLGLAGNNLAEVPSALRTGLGLLRTLDIGENRIVSVSNESFRGLEELYGLRMVDNRLIELPHSFCNSLKRLRVLNLAQNRLKKVSPTAFSGCSEVRALRLDTNNLEVVPPALSLQLPSLLWLNASVNRIRWVDYHHLPRSIEWLDLSHNSLDSLGGGSEETARNPIPSSVFHLRVLDASHNRLTKLDMTTIPPSLETLRLNHNLLRTVAPDTFTRSTHLRRIELVGNLLEVVPLSGFTFPTVPPSRNLPEVYLAGNPFICDCELEWLTRVNQVQLTVLRQHPRIMDLEAMKCKPTQSQDGNELIPLSDAKPFQFLCPYTTHCAPLCQCCDFDACDCALDCPENCSCFHDTPWSVNIVQCSHSDYTQIPKRIPMKSTEIYLDGNRISELASHVFIGKKNLRTLHLNGSEIELIKNKTFNGLKSLEILRLEDNFLTQLGGWEFQDLGNLRELYLQNNRLEMISGETFQDLKFLQVLRLDQNHLVDFNVWELSGNGYLKSVMLSYNPWSCECEFVIPFRAWVAARTSIVVDFSLAKCQRVTGEITDTHNETANSSLSFPGPTLSSICNNDLDGIPLVGGSNIVESVDSNFVEKQAVLLPQPDDTQTGSSDETIDFHPMDTDSSVILAIVLCSFVGLILFLALILIFRKEICLLCNMSRQGSKSGISSSLPCCISIGGKKSVFSPSASSGHADSLQDSEKLFDAYFIYNSEDEEMLREKLIPELEDKGSGNRFRVCLHRDLCLGLENPWNLEMVLSASESSKRIVILLSKTFLQNEWTSSSDFRRALQSALSRHQKKLIFILLPPLSVQNLSSLSTVFPELKAPTNPLLPISQNIIEWTDISFRTKLKKLLPVPSGHSELQEQNFSTIHSILAQSQQQHQNEFNLIPSWPYNSAVYPQSHNFSGKLQVGHSFWPHQHHHHFHPNHVIHPALSPPVSHGFCEGYPGSTYPVHPIIFSGPTHGPAHHNHEHQNSLSTISNTYPPLTDQNLSDSTNTMGSLGSNEHVYSTLDTPLEPPSPKTGIQNGQVTKMSSKHDRSPSGHYFV